MHQAELTRLSGLKPGVDQIRNPFGHTLAKIGDVIGTSLFPGIAANIPGTTAHHEKLINTEVEALNEGAKRGETEARSREASARADEALANARAKENPNEKLVPVKAGEGVWNPASHSWEVEPKPAASDTIEIDPEKGKALGIKPTSDGRYVLPKEAIAPFLTIQKPVEPKEGELPLGERVPQLNQALLDRIKVLDPKATALPAEYTLPANANQKDFDRIDKLLEAKERATASKAQQEQLAEMRRQTQELAQQNREKKDDTALKQAVLKSYQPVMDSAERFNVMATSYEAAIKNHDQQAMLNLLANHIGMTMGLQKGARINQAMYQEAEKSLPWLKGVKAHFDKDGYLSGVALDPEQMRQMVALGRERFTEDLVKARNESEFLGGGEGPKRTPNAATKRFYLGLAGGDLNKAKQLATTDGWTVE